jgi:hypothetical protein
MLPTGTWLGPYKIIVPLYAGAGSPGARREEGSS